MSRSAIAVRFQGMNKSILLIAILGAVACGRDPSALRDDEAMSVHVQANGLTAVNRTGRPIYYFISESQTAQLIFWAPCDDPERCKSIPAKSTVTIPFSEIVGWKPESEEAILYWWHLVQVRDGKYVFDSVRSSFLRN
jgi:hypothetical protein